MIITAVIESHGARSRAQRKRTTLKWTTVGEPNAAPASGLRICRSAIRVMTTNCSPISAPAEDPTMTQKLSHSARIDIDALAIRGDSGSYRASRPSSGTEDADAHYAPRYCDLAPGRLRGLVGKLVGIVIR